MGFIEIFCLSCTARSPRPAVLGHSLLKDRSNIRTLQNLNGKHCEKRVQVSEVKSKIQAQSVPLHIMIQGPVVQS